MELRHLRYFVAVADALSFTKAAEELHLAQPALTRQIHNLEKELGVQLFYRAGNHITLTSEIDLSLLEGASCSAGHMQATRLIHPSACDRKRVGT